MYHCGLHSQRHTLLNLTHWSLIRLNHFRLCSQSLITFVFREVCRRSLSPSLWLFPFFSLCHLPFLTSLGKKGENKAADCREMAAVGSRRGRWLISELFHAAEFISQGGYVFFVIAKLCCTSRLSPEANRTVAVRLSG